MSVVGAADGARLHPRHPGHDADRLLDRAGDGEQDLSSSEGRALRHHRDTGKGELRVDRRGKAERGPHAGRAQQRDHQIDEATLGGDHAEQGAPAGRIEGHELSGSIRTLSSTP
jgi:hypothetical protein